MSVTPFLPQMPPTAPTGAAVSTGPGAGDPAAAGFAALVASLLSAGVAAPTGSPVGIRSAEPAQVDGGSEPADEETDTEPTEPIDPTDPTGAAGTAALAGLAATMAGVVPLIIGSTAPAIVVATALEQPAGRASAEAPVERTANTPDPATLAQGEQGGPSTPDAPAPTAEVAPETPSTSAAPPAPATSAATAAPAAAAPQVTSLSPTVATAPTTPATPATPVAANPVTAQVIPEVTRLVSHGNGTHRITMTLAPEALGEVRVTLTVRDGEVRVRLAAGDDAQRALVEGAPELRRILELTGATDTRVVVRDLGQPATATHSQTTSFSADTGANRGDTAATGHGRGGPQDQHAGTRDGHGQGRLNDGAHPPRHEPVRNAISTGVDVTM